MTATSGTATTAPPIPPTSPPAATESTTASGWTRTARPRMNGWRMWPSICCTASTTISTISAVKTPCVTSATTTASAPETTAPTSGMKAKRKMKTASGTAIGTSRNQSPRPMKIASMSATITVPRTYAVRVRQARGPAPAMPGRACAGTRLRVQRQMRLPS